jgi:hypothetical protein
MDKQNEWWIGLSDSDLDWLKSNRVPCNLLTTDEYLMLKRVPPADREYFDNKGCAWCGSAIDQIASYWHRVYRLRPDWQRPKKKPDWEWGYCEVKWEGGRWFFEHEGVGYGLDCATRFKFGGVKYEEWPGNWYQLGVMKERHGNGWAPAFDIFNRTAIPATPKRVRFWRGK